ncbi:hypothetical protein A2276_02800 [candidate division WOR-1 bacterium RIFOXYA12_FULL_43_27]|uniref:HD domain-containing protein n=1 Tax=candidate division WOR-1 bacterium RIFOXYC2_FULL_46_14 TaxID=1802587 RepID=A0A1F4U9I3_UNCSA|nr:MAG: hypothetical protein A2276_02800 [candidate division WOR-1 bacterium RIFOXYA12_FULL_43_27]OGC19363.1 MAG: hypothetical protein A2292_01535 [candidate division WOR-1 bacterium RIFOXYB2_FULL_46_45]OGC30352.1 MAG: hypothetical protein A2232_01535 [candidate division WOR-1 bacterium RIFOXYA2_FULL_46_56]OGC40953.1 MAG: hypothetical protein A2438_01535 [candidate division WOR-1 bacterium RIFOXYC2_FULL_46_14]
MNLKGQIIQAMREYFGNDQKRINHALKVLKYSEELFMERKSGDEDVVVAAAILHDIGIHEAEKKYNSNAGKYQEIEGPPIAKEILENIREFPKEKISEVLDIIAHHHHPRKDETENFKILYDADCRVNREEG